MNQVDSINSLEGALVVAVSAFPAEAPEELFGNVKLNPTKIKNIPSTMKVCLQTFSWGPSAKSTSQQTWSEFSLAVNPASGLPNIETNPLGI